MAADERDEKTIRDYVEWEAGEQIVHVEKAASERVGSVRQTSGTCTARAAGGGS